VIARGIYFRRETFPAAFEKVRWMLNFPRYFGFLLTGEAGCECTYTGCHTYLWHFARGE